MLKYLNKKERDTGASIPTNGAMINRNCALANGPVNQTRKFLYNILLIEMI